jgi:hypothetical protein
VVHEVQVSNFVLPSWFDPMAPAPYDFMSEAKIEGAVAPPGPLQIAPGDGGNYIISETSQENETDKFGIRGKQRKERRDTSSRFMRRLMGRQVSQRGKMVMEIPRTVPIISGTMPTITVRVNGKPVQDSGETIQVSGEPGEPVLELPPTAERVKRDPPTSEPSVRQQARTYPSMPVSLQRRLTLDSAPKEDAPTMAPRETSEASQSGAERYMSRTEVRAGLKGPKGQIDQQILVLEGRRRLRGDRPKTR